MIFGYYRLPINRYWLRGDEEICLELATCALAFRLLLAHGYDVSYGEVTSFFQMKIA